MDASPPPRTLAPSSGNAERPGLELDPEACYGAILARDARFDGVFFVGVRTTGVYCRPICVARTPRRERCVFFRHAALAEQAGYRACFRCRPERAPGQASVDAVSRLVAAATRAIDEGALNEAGVDELAASLGVGARHLRRAMQDELGLGPVELALSRRIGLARELLLGTTLPVTQIAFASGFSSVRRFNAAFQASQKRTPSEVRRPKAAKASLTEHVLDGPRVVLDVRAPFDPAPAFAFLRARTVAGCEAVVGETYLRATAIGGHKGVIAISAATLGTGKKTALVLQISSSLGPALMPIVARTRRLFDTDADPRVIGAHLKRDPLLAKRVAARPALRVMGAFDPFEWAVRAVLGQQISVRGALTIAARLVAAFGVRVGAFDAQLDGPTHAWPDAARLAGASEEKIAAIGLTRARARTLRGLAVAVADGELVLDRSADPAVMRETLLALPGIGPWTADYIAMRSLGWPDAFPGGDLGLRKALGGISAEECERRSSLWRPWRAYAAAHLWFGLSEETG